MAIVGNVSSSKIRVYGLKEALKMLKTLPLEFREKVVRAAVSEGASLVKVAVEAEAPVETGLLQSSIRMGKRASKSSERDTVTYVVYVKGVQRNTGSRGPGKRTGGIVDEKSEDPYYWYFLEFGTSEMSAHPFLLPAFVASEQQAANVARNVAVARTERQMAKLARASGAIGRGSKR